MKNTQRISAEIRPLAAPLDNLNDSFLLDRQARRLAPGSLRFYQQKLAHLLTYSEAEGLETMGQLAADALRHYLLWLEPDHNAGGVHGCYRALRAFLKWFELEYEPEGWRNPIARVRAPRQPQELLEPSSTPIIHVGTHYKTPGSVVHGSSHSDGCEPIDGDAGRGARRGPSSRQHFWRRAAQLAE